MLYAAAAFVVGIIILLISADLFVKKAPNLSVALRISPLVIGTTIIAVGTSLPELIVSTLAAARADQGLAFGNIIGSNIANILLVFPAGILIGDLRIGTTKTQRNMVILLLASCIFYSIGRIFPYPFTGLFLIASAILFTAEEYRWGIVGRTHEDRKRFIHQKSKIDGKTLLFFIVSIIGVVVGGIITIYGVEQISRLTGYSTALLGLTIAAIGTSLPELFTTIFSEEEHEDKLAIGNIIGSNIYNVLLIGGIIHLFPGTPVMKSAEWILFLLSAGVLASIVYYYRGKVIPKKVGILLLAGFVCYILYLQKSSL